MPSDIKNRLTEELGRLKMDGDDFNRYYPQFQAYCRHIQTTDTYPATQQRFLLCYFMT